MGNPINYKFLNHEENTNLYPLDLTNTLFYKY